MRRAAEGGRRTRTLPLARLTSRLSGILRLGGEAEALAGAEVVLGSGEIRVSPTISILTAAEFLIVEE
jgi:hypothetical protein